MVYTGDSGRQRAFRTASRVLGGIGDFDRCKSRRTASKINRLRRRYSPLARVMSNITNMVQ